MSVEGYVGPCDVRRESADDEALVRRVLEEGESEAFEALICRYRSKFYRLARGIVESDSDAQDVLQKAFLKMHGKLDTLRDPSSFYSWAYRIVKNAALMKIRKNNRNSEVGFGDLGPGSDDERHFETTDPDWRNRGDEVAENEELREHLADAVEELEPKYQSAFVLYEFEGHDLEEIAGLLDLSVAGVKSRLHRARKRLRATLERYVDRDLDDDVAA